MLLTQNLEFSNEEEVPESQTNAWQEKYRAFRSTSKGRQKGLTENVAFRISPEGLRAGGGGELVGGEVAATGMCK